MKIDITKKDNLSYETHNAEYERSAADDVKWHAKNYEAHNFYEQYEVLGFKKIVETVPTVRKIHIDVGCGAGWLLKRTAPIFEKVIGIEPSASALKSAREVTNGIPNIELKQGDMVETLVDLDIKEPVFITTGTVLSHINNDWVTEFLKVVNTLPRGSILFFGEPFDKNIERPLWHIRSKAWWAAQLPNWQLMFNDHAPFGYRYGLSGILVGEENVMMRFGQKPLEKVFWNLQGRFYQIRNLIVKIVKFVLSKFGWKR